MGGGQLRMPVHKLVNWLIVIRAADSRDFVMSIPEISLLTS